MGRVSGWPGVEPLGPAPGGSALTVRVPCSPDPASLGWTSHDVTVQPDWSVEVPHDLAAERVVVALGGYCSCLELVEKVVPAARGRLQALARREPLALARATGGGWTARVLVAGCCRQTVWGSGKPDPASVAEHLRGNGHHAAAAGCRADLLRVVVAALVKAHTRGRRFTIEAADLAAARSVVLGADGVVRLWDAGAHPRVVLAVHDAVAPDGPALPPSFYLGVLARGHDLDWLRNTLAAPRPAADDAERVADLADLADWLAWTATDLDAREPGARAEYLRLGVPYRLILELSVAGVSPVAVRRLAELTGTGAAFAAALLAEWVAAGCEADPGAIGSVYRTGVPVSFRPSKALLTRVRRELGPDGRGVPTVALAGLVGVAGSVPGAVAAVLRGVTDPTCLARELDGAVRPGIGGRDQDQQVGRRRTEGAGVGA